jgi:hypothetical protein
MSKITSGTPMQLLAEQLKCDPDFMAFVLNQFCEQENLAFAELPTVLDILPEMLTRLALCRKPDSHASDFGTRVREIAYYTLADESILANVIRRVSSLHSLSTANAEAFLAAARDRNLEQKAEDLLQSGDDERDKT